MRMRGLGSCFQQLSLETQSCQSQVIHFSERLPGLCVSHIKVRKGFHMQLRTLIASSTIVGIGVLCLLH